MILSHKNRFIFIKTRKTAGTSMEIALTPCCGQDDVITPIAADEEILYRKESGPRNYLRCDIPRPSRTDGRKVPKVDVDFFNHMPAARVQEIVGPEIWDRYYKFAFVRNPWDQTVSHFHYYSHMKKKVLDFREWLFNTEQIDTIGALTIAGGTALDFIGRYENLAQDFQTALRQTGLPSVEMPRIKAGLRPPGHYRDYYDDRSRAYVEANNERLIGMFEYRF